MRESAFSALATLVGRGGCSPYVPVNVTGPYAAVQGEVSPGSSGRWCSWVGPRPAWFSAYRPFPPSHDCHVSPPVAVPHTKSLRPRSLGVEVCCMPTPSASTAATHGSSKPSLSLIHISEPTRRTPISYAVFCLKK